jgi:peptidoglycan/xylan/chitin deacetylase (PgdA/CDA1 family)
MPSLKTTVKRASMMVDRFVPPPPGITILIYHRVGGGSDSEVDLDPQVFERHLAYLAEHHRVLTLDDAVSALTPSAASGWVASLDSSPANNHRSNRTAPEQDARRGVVITFDDGTSDFTDVVVPALERHNLSATLYVATRFVDEMLAFPWGAPPTSWAALRESLATGHVTIGSHTHTHSLLDRLSPDAIGDDLDLSIERIREQLNVSPRHFAYPKALPGSPAAEIAVRRRFDTASLATSRVNQRGKADLHRLWRTPIQRGDDFDTFTLKANGGLRLEGELRSLAARARYRGADR